MQLTTGFDLLLSHNLMPAHSCMLYIYRYYVT
jgi:hypothetical protein